MKRKYLCVECAHKHNFVIPPPEGGVMLCYVFIDNEPYVKLHRSPSQAVRCSECGKKTKAVFEPFYQVEHLFEKNEL